MDCLLVLLSSAPGRRGSGQWVDGAAIVAGPLLLGGRGAGTGTVTVTTITAAARRSGKLGETGFGGLEGLLEFGVSRQLVLRARGVWGVLYLHHYIGEARHTVRHVVDHLEDDLEVRLHGLHGGGDGGGNGGGAARLLQCGGVENVASKSVE